MDGVSANADGGAVGDSHLATRKFDRQVDFNFNVKHMTTHPASTGRARVTLRHLAELASVSTQAVSLALRNHPSIGRSTRDRIRALALREGYAPDPHLVKLMHHLRGRKTPKATASVCALTTRPPNLKEKFCDLLLKEREKERAQQDLLLTSCISTQRKAGGVYNDSYGSVGSRASSCFRWQGWKHWMSCWTGESFRSFLLRFRSRGRTLTA